MNRFAKMLIQDKRNPYGSRGGYVVSGSRRDYGEDYEYTRGMDRNDYRGDMRRDYEHDYRRDREMDYARRDRGDYATYHDMRDYGDYRMRDRRMRDYGEPEMFTKRDIEDWNAMMKNEDGTRGAHFRPEDVKRACEKAGIDCEEFGDDVFDLAMNKQYSDYCKVAKKYGVDTPEYYADMAKAFLKDKDGASQGEEKLYVYFKTLVEKDD